jgi:hypothetical protein
MPRLKTQPSVASGSFELRKRRQEAHLRISVDQQVPSEVKPRTTVTVVHR